MYVTNIIKLLQIVTNIYIRERDIIILNYIFIIMVTLSNTLLLITNMLFF